MTTIYTFAQSAIEEAQNAGRYGTANLYTSAIKSFRKFTGDIPLTFKELTPGLIKKGSSDISSDAAVVQCI